MIISKPLSYFFVIHLFLISSGMDFPEVEACCFGLLPLKTGSLAIGILSIILEVGAHGYESYYATCGNPWWVRWVFFGFMIWGVVASLALMIGVLSDSALLVRFYLVTFLLLAIISVVAIVYFEGYRNSLPYMINTCLYILFVAYCLIVVNSYFMEM